jgi:integrase
MKQVLPAGLYRAGKHYRAIAYIGAHETRQQKECAFRQRDTETLADMILRAQIWQDETRAALRKLQPTAARGTLRADAKTFLATMPEGATRDRYACELVPWLDALVDPARPRLGTLGDRRRDELTRVDVLKQRATWQAAGLAASTINHYVFALRKLYWTLDGDTAPNPTTRVKRIPPPRPEARAVDVALLLQVLEAMPAMGRSERGLRNNVNQSKARLQVHLTTGMAPAQIMRLQRTDLDLKGTRTDVHDPGPHVYASPRLKGSGAIGVWLPLTPAGVAALRAFDAGDCYGPYSTSAAAKCFHRAVNRYAAQLPSEKARAAFRALLPPGFRPYDARHSFATEVLRVTKDYNATNALLQHAPDSTVTRRYTVGARAAVMSAAIAAVAAAMAPPPPPRTKGATSPRTRRTTLRAIAGGKR